MITLKEIRIGNLVMIENDLLPETKGEIYKVSGFQSRFDLYFPGSTGVIFLDHIKSFRTYNQFDEFVIPIPLTEEFLLKTDLQSEEDGFWDKEGIINFQIKLNECEVYYNGEYLTVVYSFNELQNLIYALTGTELTINENSL